MVINAERDIITASPGKNFSYDLAELEIPQGTTLVVIVNPNNPNGGIFDMTPLPNLLQNRKALPRKALSLQQRKDLDQTLAKL